MKEKLEELKKDFKDTVSKINFQRYDPYSRDFMTPLFIGMLFVAMKMICDDDDVEEELDGAKEYMKRYSETMDNSYKDMAVDELRHAGILIKKHLENGGDKLKLEEQDKERHELMKKVSKEV